MKKLIAFSLCALFLPSCTMHREAKARRVNARHSAPGKGSTYCPQTYGYNDHWKQSRRNN